MSAQNATTRDLRRVLPMSRDQAQLPQNCPSTRHQEMTPPPPPNTLPITRQTFSSRRAHKIIFTQQSSGTRRRQRTIISNSNSLNQYHHNVLFTTHKKSSCYKFISTISCYMFLSLLPVLFCSSTPLHNQAFDSNAGQVFSCGKLYYRTFHLDQQRNVLYVGAMDNLFKVNLANVNKTNCLDDAIRLEPTDTQKCITKGKSESFECRNHIKVIQPMSRLGDKLYICGTNAYNPRDYLVYANNLSTSSDLLHGIGGPAQAECPFDPDDNSTAVWVESGNPSNAPAIYTGTATDFTKADHLIFRTELYNQTTGQKIHEAKRTTKYDSKWLDKPNFVGSFEIGDYVYFFFRESAVEYINCGKSIYSRVARVCKRDNGFKPSMYEKVWTTFLKARLNCSIPGEFPFYFDEIQSIYRNPYDERKFHAVFTTSNNGLTGSAICTFSLDAIQEAFNGKFKEQQSSTAAWLPVPSYKLNQNEPRPGTCVDDTQALSDNLVTFIRGHPLMDSAVANDNNRPVFYRRDVMFTRIVVDIVEIDGIRYTIYFAGTSTGHVHKIVEWTSTTTTTTSGQQQQQDSLQGNSFLFGTSSASSSSSAAASEQLLNTMNGGASSQSFTQSGGATQSTLVEIIDATVPEPVRAMELSARHKSLYVASDSQVKQINLLNCKQRHDNCVQCVRDPYCGWDRKHLECRHVSTSRSGVMDSSSSSADVNLLQDITSDSPDLCHAAVKHKDVHVNWGQSVHLPCKFNGFVHETQDLQQLLAAQQQQQQGFYGSAAETSTAPTQQHGLVQPPNYIQWFYHRRDTLVSPGYPLLQRRDKFILAADQGLVIMNANEPGWYQCRLGSQIIHSYNLIIDTKTCAAPNENEFKQIYADWCREMERYKSAYRNWHAKQSRCQTLGANQHLSQQQQQVLLANSNHFNNQHHQQQQQQQQQLGADGLWTSQG